MQEDRIRNFAQQAFLTKCSMHAMLLSVCKPAKSSDSANANNSDTKQKALSSCMELLVGQHTLGQEGVSLLVQPMVVTAASGCDDLFWVSDSFIA